MKKVFSCVAVGMFSVLCASGGVNSGRHETATVSDFTPRFHWFQNRVSDFCDIFHMGVGLTHESPATGPWTPSFGLHAQVTDYGHLGGVVFGGGTAEMEGRGFGAYSEVRKIAGFGPWKMWNVVQGTESVSFYKDPKQSRAWQSRMDFSESFNGDPAHVVIHNDASSASWNNHPRGWHNFAYTGAEIAIPLGIPYTPLDTHWGIDCRLGVDTSQVADFILGIFGVDFWHDDLRAEDMQSGVKR